MIREMRDERVRERAMLTCRELTEFLDDYIADVLAADRRAVFDRHLAVCPDCRNYLASYQATVRLVKVAGEATMQGVPDGLIKAVTAARDQKGEFPATEVARPRVGTGP
jgi:anti-sigma factor RsiW